MFAGSHLPGSGLITTLTIDLIGGLLLGGLYLLRRNLYLTVAAHAIFDLPPTLFTG